MKKRYVNALLLGMTLCVSVPGTTVSASEVPAQESSAESTSDAELEEILREVEEDVSTNEEEAPAAETEGSGYALKLSDVISDMEQNVSSGSYSALTKDDVSILKSYFEAITPEDDYDTVSKFITSVLNCYGDKGLDGDSSHAIEKSFEKVKEITNSFVNVYGETEVLDGLKEYVKTELEALSVSEEEIKKITDLDSIDSIYDMAKSYLQKEEASDNTGSDDSGNSDNKDSDTDNSGDGNSGNNDNESGNDNDASDAALKEAVENALTEIDSIDISTLTGDRKAAAEKYLTETKDKINKATSVDDINVIIAEAAATIDGYLADETLENQKSAAKDSLKEFFDKAVFDTDELKAVAKEIYDTAVQTIDGAKSIEDVNSALDDAKDDIQDVIDQKDGVLDTLRECAKKSIAEVRDTITTKSDLPDAIRSLAEDQIYDAKSAASIQSIKTVAKEILTNMRSVLDEKSKASAVETIKSLRGLTLNSEDPDLLAYMAEKVSETDYNGACVLMSSAIDYVSMNDADYKDFLVDDMKDALSNVSSDNVDNAKKIYNDTVSSMNNASRLDCYKAYETAMEKLEKMQADDAVSVAKKEAEAKLDKLLDGITDKTVKAKAEDIISGAKSDLKDAKTTDDVDKIVKDATDKVEKAKKEASDAEKLETKKKSYQTKLDDLIKNVTDSELKSTLSKIVTSAKSDIANATSEEQMNEILTKAKSDIKHTTVEYSQNKALATKKAQLIEKLTTLADGKTLSSEALSIISQAKIDVIDASTSEDAISIYNTAVASFKETYVSDLRTSYKEKLDDLDVAADSSLDDTTKTKISDLVTKAKANIDKTSSEDAMQQIYDQAEKSVSLLKENSSSLDKVKEDAINELKNYTTLNTESVQKVISAYSNKIQSATSEDQVKQYLSDAKGLLDKLNAAAGITSSTDQNSSTGGSSTSGTDVQSASKKGDDTATSSVKTGDENGIRIFASIAAMIVGIGTIGAMVYLKFIKKKK